MHDKNRWCVYGYFKSKRVELENLRTLRMTYAQCFIHTLCFCLCPAWSVTTFTGSCFIWLRRQEGSLSPTTTWGTSWTSQMCGEGLFRRGKKNKMSRRPAILFSNVNNMLPFQSLGSVRKKLILFNSTIFWWSKCKLWSIREFFLRMIS